VAFDLPRDVIISLSDVRVALDAAPHPFALANVAASAANWEREKALKPALYDGEIALLSELRLDGDRLVGRCHIVRYSTFLYWRTRRDAGAGHAYTHAMLVSSDNALIAARMGDHTVNAGLVYFAAGSFEPVDFVGGIADLAGNMRREVLEETGIDLADVAHEPTWHAVAKDSGTVVFRRYFLDAPADEIAERIRTTIAAQDEPEISGAVVIRNQADRPERLTPQMHDLIDWHFATPRRW
jgi:8-oxo-dGTP pyrophosphatase MutT (NUDIX family)